MFVGHDEGAVARGRIASLIVTAKLNGVALPAYLRVTLLAYRGGHPVSKTDELQSQVFSRKRVETPGASAAPFSQDGVEAISRTERRHAFHRDGPTAILDVPWPPPLQTYPELPASVGGSASAGGTQTAPPMTAARGEVRLHV